MMTLMLLLIVIELIGHSKILNITVRQDSVDFAVPKLEVNNRDDIVAESKQQSEFTCPESSDFVLGEMFRKEHERIDSEDVRYRCEKYGYTYNETKKRNRRIFAGMPIADDDWDVLAIQAVENYGLFEVVVFSESNTTHTGTYRPLRFPEGSDNWCRLKGLFGPPTNVIVDYFLESFPGVGTRQRESCHRNTLNAALNKAGLQREDVVLVSDTDEVVSRDFMWAVKTCEIPELEDLACAKPKIVTAAMGFELTPECIPYNNGFHPDFISGNCWEGVGDPTDRVVPLRDVRREFGRREPGFGMYPPIKERIYYYESVIARGRYPLFSGADMRDVEGARGLTNFVNLTGHGTSHHYGISYHIHNFFTNLTVMQNKYLTYGESVGQNAYGSMCGWNTVSYACQCLKNDGSFPGYPQGFAVKGPKPIFFLNNTYRNERHNLVKEWFTQDQATFGKT